MGTLFEEGSEGLMACDEGSGSGPAGELMDLMRRLLRLREGVCVVFEDRMVVVEDWVWLRKYVKPRILERGVEAGLSVVKSLSGDDEAVGIKKECYLFKARMEDGGWRMNTSQGVDFGDLIRCCVR